jgi:hypothetical protein
MYEKAKQKQSRTIKIFFIEEFPPSSNKLSTLAYEIIFPNTIERDSGAPILL